MRDMETETNPIDRNVAHLLFHRPLELPGRHPKAPESPFSSRLVNIKLQASLTHQWGVHLRVLRINKVSFIKDQNLLAR